DDPINKAVFYQRDYGRHPEAGGREGAGEAHSDRHVVLQHLFDKKLAGLAKPGRVIGQKSRINQIGDRHIAGNSLRIYRGSAEESLLLRHRPFFTSLYLPST